MLLFCFTNAQSFFHDKSSSISQFINDKPRDLQKLISYMSGTVTSTFKICTGGQVASPPFPYLCGIFPTFFVLYSHNSSSEALSSISIILCLYNNSINLLIS